jgi:CRP-like cAMP-binding protein
MSKKNPLGYFKHSDEYKTFRAGERVFAEGDDGHEMYVVKAGKVELLAGSVPLEVVEPGGILGEMALISDDKRIASAQAIEESQLVPIDRDKFRFLVQQTPDFALEVMKVLAQRLRKMNVRHTKIIRGEKG